MTYPVLLDVLAPSKRMIEMEGGFLHLTTSGDKIRLSMKVQSFVFFFFLKIGRYTVDWEGQKKKLDVTSVEYCYFSQPFLSFF
jgi:hypothetical protein